MDYVLVECATIADWKEYGNSEEFLQYLVGITANEDEAWKRDQLSIIDQWSSSHKSKFHPENKSQDLIQLKKELLELMEKQENTEEIKNKKKELLACIAKLRASLEEELKYYNKVTQKIENKISMIVQSLNKGAGKSNRARKAGLLTKHAGKSRIEGAAKDTHGNAKGTEFDLGVDGAFNSFEIVVLQLYTFAKDSTVKAFELKGFKYQWFSGEPPTPKSLAMILDSPSVCQLWVISSHNGLLNQEHYEVIAQFFRSGKSLYLWGDNVPYYVEANGITKQIFGCTDLDLFGNADGQKTVSLHKVDDNGKQVGIIEHLITTGVELLYEGHTVASLDSTKIGKHGFVPILYGSAGNLITAARPGRDGCGAIILDGAFTRLYVNSDDAGTIRFIINAACWLAVESCSRPLSVDDLKDEPDKEELIFSPENALSGAVCSISFEDVPIGYLSFMKLGDEEANTTDWVLNDPLGYGEMNHRIIGRNIYGEHTGNFIVEIGKDPYLRTPVAGLLPAVDLGIQSNYSLFSDELCRIFMANKKLYSQAQLLFVATLDFLIESESYSHFDDDTKRVIEFMFEQGLSHFKSTPDFSDVGDKVPLLDAMKLYFTVSPPLVQISKSFSTVCLMARTLHKRKLVDLDHLVVIVRRSFFKYLISSSVKFVKEKRENSDELQKELSNLFYECWNYIPKLNSARIISSLPSFIPNFYETSLQRFERATGKSLLNFTEISYLFHLLTKFDNLALFRVESLIEILLKNHKFVTVWDNTDSLEDSFVIQLLNNKFNNISGVPGGNHSLSNCFVPFATVFGPTVFRCSGCEAVFGDPDTEPTDAACEAIKNVRNKHFKVFRSDERGYPMDKSHHFSLHKTIQTVMTSQFPRQLELKDEMIVAVANKLVACKGNIYRENIEEMIVRAISSFLELRKHNVAAEFVSERLSFKDRLIMERNNLLTNK